MTTHGMLKVELLLFFSRKRGKFFPILLPSFPKEGGKEAKKGCGREAPPHPFFRITLPSPHRGGAGGGAG